MADILLVQGAPLFDLDGAILAGGSVTFYRSGTTTLADIWADADATVPLANPLDADAQGYIPAVFFSGAYAVKAVLRDADGARVRTIDPLPRGGVSVTGASAISFLPISGNAATTVQAAIANNTDRLDTLDDDLGTAAYADLATSSTDATVGRVLRTGAFGLGASVAPRVTGASALDDLATSGLYYVASTDVASVGGPTGAGGACVLHMAFTGTNSGAQVWVNVGTATRAWMRRKASGTWTAWSEVLSGDTPQTWQDMSASRAADTVYQNTTGRPIVVNVKLDASSARTFDVSADNSTWVTVHIGSISAGNSVSTIVPNGHYYRATGALASGSQWVELR